MKLLIAVLLLLACGIAAGLALGCAIFRRACRETSEDDGPEWDANTECVCRDCGAHICGPSAICNLQSPISNPIAPPSTSYALCADCLTKN